MIDTVVHVRIKDSDIERIDPYISIDRFTSRSHFLRAAARNYLEQLEKENEYGN